MSAIQDKNKSTYHGMQLLLVQSIVCLFLVIAVGMFRMFGGNAFHELASRFRDAMLDTTLVTAIVNTTGIVNVSACESPDTDICAPLEQGVLTSSYGVRSEQGSKSIHEGVDIAAEEGSILSAFKSGVVTTVSFDENGYGHYVVVSCNNGEKYLYAHCASVLVDEGEPVSVGQAIATVGNTGRSSGNHLHFEWIVNETPVDPTRVLPMDLYV